MYTGSLHNAVPTMMTRLAAQLSKDPKSAGNHRHDLGGGFCAGAVEHEAAAVPHAVRCLWNACRRAELSEASNIQ
jgi:hypothetical protein